MKRVVIAISGGVDSAVTTLLLKEKGYDVVAMFMSNGVEIDDSLTKRKSCCSLEDAVDAKRVANKLGIPFYSLNFSEHFRERIIKYFVQEYTQGRTPNPCVVCNHELKFGALLEYADSVGADFVATGHYAIIQKSDSNGRYILRKGIDATKDQSYMLFGLTQTQLAKTLFPLGEYFKEDVKKIAEQNFLPVYDKPESQELCFVASRDYRKFFQEKFPESLKPGKIFDDSGREIGSHPGIQFFTIGQRHNIGVSKGIALYVIKIDPATNSIIVGSEEKLYKKTFLVKDVNWVSLKKLEISRSINANVKIRYKHEGAQAIITNLDGENYRIDFSEPQKSITPGQAAVFYADDILLGGGWID